MTAYLIVFSLLTAAFLLFPKRKNTKKAALMLLVMSLIFEVAIANFHSFHLIGGGYEKAELSLTDENVTIVGNDDKSPTAVRGRSLTITFNDVGQRIGTLHISLTMPQWMNYVDVRIDATDETQSASFRSNVADGRILSGRHRTEYIVLDLSGKVDDIRLTLTGSAPFAGASTDGSEEAFTVSSVVINKNVPFEASPLRLILLVIGSMALYALFTFPSMKMSYGENKKYFRNAAFIMTGVCLACAIVITYASMYDESGRIKIDLLGKSGNQISQEIVDAFRQGQVHLTAEPSQELLNMENPYDWSARSELGVNAKWDHLLFDGKYYSYYGIAPVLLLFLPYNLLTDCYFPSAEAILLFGALGMIFLSLLFLEFADRFCRKLPNSMLISTLAVLLLSCGVWYNFVYDNFYEIAQASGFMFTCAGFYFLLRSGILGEGKIRIRHIAIGTACLGFAVLCRPTLALYCITACIILVFGYFKLRRTVAETNSVKTIRSRSIKYILAAIIPFAVLGGIQMLYNYARFGNIFDFGIQYSLTINDFTRSQYHTDLAMIGLHNFIFAFPTIMPEFPYVFSNFSTLSVNGYYFVANRNAVGILWRALPSFGYLGAITAWRTLSRRERLEAVCMLMTTCVIAPLIIIFSIWESGYGVRYCCDFAWQIILGGAAVLYLIYVRAAVGQGKTILRHVFTVSAALSLIVNGAMIYDYLQKSGFLADRYLSFARVFDFWI